MAIQKAAATALDNDAIADKVKAKYYRRLNKLVTMLQSVGFECKMPGGTYFLYTKAPKSAGNTLFENAEQAHVGILQEPVEA